MAKSIKFKNNIYLDGSSIRNYSKTINHNTTNVPGFGYTNCYVYGKICIVCFNVQLANNLAGGSELLTNLPKTKQNRVMFAGAFSNGSAARFYIENTTIYNDGAISTGGWIDGNLVYMIE